MNDLPRQTLSRIIAKHGREISDAPERVEGLLRDLCGAHRREINIIMGALEERVAADLIAAGNSVPREVILARLAARLRDNLAYTAEAARWGVETWAVALGFVSEAELQERMHGEVGGAGAGAPQPTVRDSKPPVATPAAGSRQAPEPRRGTSYPPQSHPQKSSQPPPVFNPPAPMSRRSPPAPHKVVLPTSPPQTRRPLPEPQPTSRRGLKIRSCLFIIALVFALIVAAVFAIPAIILLLQEEQSRPSINDPRMR